jgi:hypothetical protein
MHCASLACAGVAAMTTKTALSTQIDEERDKNENSSIMFSKNKAIILSLLTSSC